MDDLLGRIWTIDRRVLVAAIAAYGVGACSGEEPQGQESLQSDDARDGCVTSFEPGRDYYQDKAAFRHARNVRVDYRQHFKVVDIRVGASEWGSPQSDRLVLVRCGTPAPPLEGDLEGATVVTIPVRRVVSNEDQTPARLASLGLADRVVGLGGGGVYTPELVDRWESGEIVAVGESFHGAPNLEALLGARPDVVFLFSSTLDHREALDRVRGLGLPTVPVVAWGEPTPLGQAEWIKVAGIFTDAEVAAESLFSEIETEYERLVDLVEEATDTPTVVFGGSVASGRWEIEVGSWSAMALRDAGARIPFDPTPGETAITVNTEALVSSARLATKWVTEHQNLSIHLGAPALAEIPAVRDRQVWSVHRRAQPERDAYDWYESAALRPDLVLADFIAILHPELLPGHEYHFLEPMEVR